MLVGLLGTVFNVALLMYLSRRLLGVPIGWGRTLVISAITNGLAFTAAESVLESVGASETAIAMPHLLLALLLACWAFTLQLMALTVLEALVPTSSVPSLLTVVTETPARFRRLRRYARIWWILLRRGLGTYLGNGPTREADVPRIAASLRLALTDAGVTFVKLGQMLSTRPDLLPPAFVAELSKLQSEVDPEPYESVAAQVRAAVGGDPDEIFASFSRTPLAAASVAQIHAATLQDGTKVVVKVQRPRARAQATADLDIVGRLADRLERRTPWGRRIGARSLADGFAESLYEELDYRIELANMRGVATASDALRVPVAYPELSSEDVLVMEWIDGEPLSKAGARLAALQEGEREELAGRLFHGVLRQILVTGVFHADLHPGNILIGDEGLALLDFGSVGRLDRSTRQSLGLLLMAVDREDALTATDTLVELLERPDDLDDRALERELGQLLLRIGGPGGTAGLFMALLDLILRHGFSVPPQLAAAFRALGALEGSLTLLDPDADLVSLARIHGQSVMEEQWTPEAAKARLSEQLVTILPMLQRLPRRIDRITEQLEDGSFAVQVRSLQGEREQGFIGEQVEQIAMTVLGSALGIGGVLLFISGGGPAFLPNLSLHAFLGLALLFVAFVIGTRVMVAFFHRSRHTD